MKKLIRLNYIHPKANKMKHKLALLAVSALFMSCNHEPRTIENPVCFASNTNEDYFQLKVTRVDFTDTATVLTFHFTSKVPEYKMGIPAEAVLIGEKGKEYHTKFFKEKNFGENFGTTPEGMDLTVGFEPMPTSTQIFDYYEGFNDNFFKIAGIHDSAYHVKPPKYSKKELAELDTYRKNFFKSGKAVLKGSLEGYSRNDGYESMTFYYDDLFTGEQTPIMVDVDENGNFETEITLDHPKAIWGRIQASQWSVSKHTYLEPGDTLTIEMLSDGRYRFRLSDKRPFKLEHFFNCALADLRSYPYEEFWKDLKELTCDEFVDKMNALLEKDKEYANHLATQYNFTAFEYQYALYHLTLSGAISRFLDYRMYTRMFAERDFFSIKEELTTDTGATYHSFDQDEYQSFLDELYNKITTEKSNEFFRNIPANDCFWMNCASIGIIYNRYRFDPAFTNGIDEFKPYPNMLQRFIAEDSIKASNDTALFKGNELSLFGKICILQNFKFNITNLINADKRFKEEKDSVTTMSADYLKHLKELLNNDFLYSKAEQIYNDLTAEKSPFYELPDCKGKKVLQEITAKYPGKYVYIDFWSTGCGPCVTGIKSCRKNHPELMKNIHDKYVLVFITDDPEQCYKPFYDENMAGSESYRLSHDDYASLADMFKFSAIPHHEMVTPEGLVVRETPSMESIDPKNPLP